VLFIYVSWRILCRLSNPNTALLGSLFIAFSPAVIRSSALVLSDIMGAALVISVFALVILPRQLKVQHGVLAGVLCCLAYFTRHAYLVGLALPILRFLFSPQGNTVEAKIKYALAFYLSFVLLISPWCLFLFREKGDPFWSHHHLNIAFSMYRGDQGWNALPNIDRYASLTDVIKSDPTRFMKTIAKNLIKQPAWLFGLVPFIGLLGAAGFFVWLKPLTPEKLVFFVFAILLCSSLALVWFDCRYYLPLLPLCGGSVAYGIALVPSKLEYSGSPEVAGRILAFVPLRKTIVVTCFLMTLTYSVRGTVSLFNQDASSDYFAAAKILSPLVGNGDSVLASKPHITHYCQLQNKKLKLVDFRSTGIELQHRTLDEFPVLLVNAHPTYFVYDESYGAKEFPHLKIFLFPDKNPFPELLEHVFTTEGIRRIVVYRVIPSG
jgi:4-amino-4-deoxy-L-arabinose transferase-like glycosyltransferase